MTPWSKWITNTTTNEDLAIVSMVTYRTLAPARMPVFGVVLQEQQIGQSSAQHSKKKNDGWEKLGISIQYL
jgi:hypothetical protein